MSEFPVSYIDQVRAEAREEARTDMIKSLLSQGLTPNTISNMGLATPEQVVNILHVHLNGRIHTPEDEELAILARKLAKQAIAEAAMLIDRGPMQVKLSLIQAAIRPVAKMIGNDEGNTHEQAYAAVEAMMAEMRQLPSGT